MDNMLQLMLSDTTITFGIIGDSNNRMGKERHWEVIHNVVDGIRLN